MGIAIAVLVPAGSLYLVWTMWLGKNREVEQITRLLKANAIAVKQPFDEDHVTKELHQLDYYNLLKVHRLIKMVADNRDFISEDSAKNDVGLIKEIDALYRKIKQTDIPKKMDFKIIEVALFGT